MLAWLLGGIITICAGLTLLNWHAIQETAVLRYIENLWQCCSLPTRLGKQRFIPGQYCCIINCFATQCLNLFDGRLAGKFRLQSLSQRV